MPDRLTYTPVGVRLPRHAEAVVEIVERVDDDGSTTHLGLRDDTERAALLERACTAIESGDGDQSRFTALEVIEVLAALDGSEAWTDIIEGDRNAKHESLKAAEHSALEWRARAEKAEAEVALWRREFAELVAADDTNHLTRAHSAYLRMKAMLTGKGTDA
jgi:hypothetical protein